MERMQESPSMVWYSPPLNLADSIDSSSDSFSSPAFFRSAGSSSFLGPAFSMNLLSTSRISWVSSNCTFTTPPPVGFKQEDFSLSSFSNFALESAVNDISSLFLCFSFDFSLYSSLSLCFMSPLCLIALLLSDLSISGLVSLVNSSRVICSCLLGSTPSCTTRAGKIPVWHTNHTLSLLSASSTTSSFSSTLSSASKGRGRGLEDFDSLCEEYPLSIMEEYPLSMEQSSLSFTILYFSAR